MNGGLETVSQQRKIGADQLKATREDATMTGHEDYGSGWSIWGYHYPLLLVNFRLSHRPPPHDRVIKEILNFLISLYYTLFNPAKVEWMKNILVLGLFLSLVSLYGRTADDTPYVVLLLSMSLILLGYLIKFFQRYPIGFKINFSIKDFSPFDRLLSSTLIRLWSLIIASWLIGVLIGLVNNVDPSFVFRNFLGLIVYMIFPVMLIVSPSLKSLIGMIFLAGMVQMFYGFEQSYGFMLNPLASYTGLSFTDMRSVYNTGCIVIFPLFTVGVAYQLLPKNYFSNDHGRSENNGQMVSILSKSLIFTFLTLIAIVVPAMSKGFILAAAILFLSVVFFFIKYSLKTGRIHKVVMLLVFLVLLLYLLPSSFYETIIYSYSPEEDSNATKIHSYGYLVAELTFWGNGLGSSLISGHAASTKSYAFELTYVNIVHKLGVFSIFLFLSYVITLMVASIRIIKRVYVFESFFVIGLMGYLVAGAGNPILLDPNAVVLHCVAMYILIKPFLRPLKENHVVSPICSESSR